MFYAILMKYKSLLHLQKYHYTIKKCFMSSKTCMIPDNIRFQIAFSDL